MLVVSANLNDPTAKFAIDQNFHKDELIMLNVDQMNMRDYTERFIKEIEDVIANNAMIAYRYAEHVIKGRWPEAETTIKNDPIAACEYAGWVIKDRWPEAEETIKQCPSAAYWYALTAIKGRWVEAETTIMADSWSSIPYGYLMIVDDLMDKLEHEHNLSRCEHEYRGQFNDISVIMKKFDGESFYNECKFFRIHCTFYDHESWVGDGYIYHDGTYICTKEYGPYNDIAELMFGVYTKNDDPLLLMYNHIKS